VPDRFIDHGDHAGQLAECGLDAAGILSAITAHRVFRRITTSPRKETSLA
jgi:1-deoxy-D-xylulose-5-phosphate synthase